MHDRESECPDGCRFSTVGGLPAAWKKFTCCLESTLGWFIGFDVQYTKYHERIFKLMGRAKQLLWPSNQLAFGFKLCDLARHVWLTEVSNLLRTVSKRLSDLPPSFPIRFDELQWELHPWSYWEDPYGIIDHKHTQDLLAKVRTTVRASTRIAGFRPVERKAPRS